VQDMWEWIYICLLVVLFSCLFFFVPSRCIHTGFFASVWYMYVCVLCMDRGHQVFVFVNDISLSDVRVCVC